jgi:putative serine protease PepD
VVRQEGYLGVSLDDRRDGGQGAVITEVQSGFPAEDAGLLEGDVVIAVDDAVVDGAAGLIAAIRDREPGDEVSITVIRDGETRTLVATLVTRPEA